MVSTRRFAGNFVIQLVGRALSIVFGLITVGVLTRSLGAHGFGEYTTAVTFLQLFGVIVDLGLTLTLVVMISEAGANEERIVGNVFGLRLVTGAIVFGLAPLIILAFPYSETIKSGVLVGALAYLFMAAAGMLTGVFQKHAVVWRAALAELANRTVLLGLIAILASLNLGTVAMIAAAIVANAVWLALTLVLARPFVRIAPRFNFAVWKETLSRSWPIALSIAFNLIYLKGDILFLSLLRDQTEVGLYGVAYRVLDVLTALPTLFMGLLLPSLVADWNAGKKEEFRRHLSRGFNAFMMIVVPIVIGAQAVAEPLAILIAGEDFTGSGPVLRLLIIAVFGVFVGALYGHAVVAVGKQRPMIWAYAAVAVLSVIGYLWLIPAYGMTGAAYVTIASEFLMALLCFIAVWKASGALPQLSTAFKALLSSLIMYGVIVLLPPLPVVVTIALAAVVYFAAMLITGGIRRETILELMPRRLAVHKTD